MINHTDINDGYLLAHAGQSYRTVAEACIHTMGLRRAQVMLLMELSKHEGMTQIELAENLSMNGATVSEMLLRLEETQLIVRQRDAADRRLVRVYLTDAGREKWQSIQDHMQNLEKMVFEGVHPEQRLAMRRLLHQLLHNISKTTQECQLESKIQSGSSPC